MDSLHASHCFVVLTAMFCIVTTGAGAAPAADEPAALLRRAVGEVLAVNGAPGATPASVHDGMRPLLEKYVDTRLLTRRAIGPGWREFTAAQQQRAATLFVDLALGVYADNCTKPSVHLTIVYRATVELGADHQEVPTSMTADEGQPVEVAFRFEHTAAGLADLRHGDVGVSLVGNYRSQLDPIFNETAPTECCAPWSGRRVEAGRMEKARRRW